MLDGCEFPVLVLGSSAGTINLASNAAAELFGLPLHVLVGGTVLDYVEPRGSVDRAGKVLASGEADGLCGIRQLRREPLGVVSAIPVQFWTRVIEVGGQRNVLALLLPVNEVVSTLGPDPLAPWRCLTPIAIGLADEKWQIEEISTEIFNIAGRTPNDLIDTDLRQLFDQEDVSTIVSVGGVPPTTHLRHVRLIDNEINGDEVSLMVAPIANQRAPIIFVVAGAPDSEDEINTKRVLELETRLRRIGTEVRAAGLLDGMDELPAIRDNYKLGELTIRQQEVLGRLLQGQRVTTIASQLFIGQSTVRNHLAAIFQKFGVHSQAELIELLLAKTS